MSLRQKLARLSSVESGLVRGAERSPDDTRRRVEALRQRVDEVVARSRTRVGSSRAASTTELQLPGELRSTEHGLVQVVDEVLEPSHCHGHEPVSGALEVDPSLVARLALEPSLSQVDLRRLVILDTETTGLSTASGTLPFLVGLAWFEDESLHVQQMFLRTPGEEAALLHMVRERLRWASCLVTYNGKSFDVPLLRTRFVLQRVPMPSVSAHLDLLHCARRIYRRRLKRVRLIHMEQAVLGLTREHDVDGAEIPTLYLDYLRRGTVAPLARVIEHNANDLVALAAILGTMGRHFSRVVREDDPRDHLGFALCAERAKDHPRAAAFAQAAADGGGDENTTVDALFVAARTARRCRDWRAEHRALTRVLESTDSALHRAEANLALAKVSEHRMRDLVAALAFARHTSVAEGCEANAHRVARLERRIASRSQDAGL